MVRYAWLNKGLSHATSDVGDLRRDFLKRRRASQAPACLSRRVRLLRHNRRKTNGIGRIAARAIELLVARRSLTTRKLIDDRLDAALPVVRIRSVVGGLS
jgi:hypothetical protein